MIDVALLGSGGSMPIPDRFLTSTLINYQGKKILIDCGEGCQVSMKLIGWGFKSIDIICLTHFHGDHLFGLPGLLSTIGNCGRTDSIIIMGPKGLENILKGLKELLPYLPYELIAYENPDSYAFEQLEIKTINLDHSTICLGYQFIIKRRPKFDILKAERNKVPKILFSKLQKGEKIVFEKKIYTPDMVLGEARKGIKICIITDTRPINTIPQFIKDSNLFICEGTYGDEADIEKAIKNKHMTYSEAAGLAKAGNVREMILTHFSPIMLDPSLYLKNATNIFSNTIIGEDRLIKQLNFN